MKTLRGMKAKAHDRPHRGRVIGSRRTAATREPDRPEALLGAVDWFRIGEYDRVRRVLSELKELNVRHFRTSFSWAEWHTPEGGEWYSWLIPTLGRELDLLPCVVYTPPSRGVAPKTSAPPRVPKDYADFIDQMITLFGEYFEWVEFWNEPNNLREWDMTLDPKWEIFSSMINGAAYWAKHRGKKTVLGGSRPVDPNWLKLMCQRGVLENIDAVGVHGYPQTFELSWEGWDANVAKAREVLEEHSSKAEVWITETGYSTWRYDEKRQLAAFVNAIDAPVQRVYWYSAHDLDPVVSQPDGQIDSRKYHFGLMRVDGSPKLLARIWVGGGIEAVKRAVWLGEPFRNGHKQRPVLITGGSGFIGTNLADRILSTGRPVLIFDNLSRPGVERNLQWLKRTHGNLVQVEIADVRDPHALRVAVKEASQVFHFAAQVAVTTSLMNPLHDFEINGRGTLNLLEALRAVKDPPSVVFTSTNKVYGALEDLKLVKNGTHYEPRSPIIRAHGIGEDRRLDFHSPYGCSKGTADQYVLDYARTFSLPAVVFRMSCIYGPHQFGNEDQGWVAHFALRALEGRPISVYGDGKQVRDVLFVQDLVDALLLAQENMDDLAGQAFNIGGGPENTLSLLELIDIIGELHRQKPPVRFDEWRIGDQRYYVSDIRKFREATGWAPAVDVRSGVERLYSWLVESLEASSPDTNLARGAEQYEVLAR